jgi:toxin ParE1/3/4
MMMPDLRHLALDRAIYWFRLRIQHRDIQVLAVFFGGQDHQRRMSASIGVLSDCKIVVFGSF